MASTLLTTITSSLSSPSSPETSLTVPWEIVVLIVRETEDPSTLASFSFVCFDVLRVAGPLLWRDLFVDSYFKMASIFHEPSPPPLMTSRIHPYLGLHLLQNLHFFLPDPEANALLPDPRLNLPPSCLPNPGFHLPIHNLTLKWTSTQPVDSLIQLFAHLDPKTYSQIFHPAKSETTALDYEIVESEELWICSSFSRWTRLDSIYSSRVLHCGKNMLPGMPAGGVDLPFMGEFVERLPHHVFNFRRRRRRREEEGGGEKDPARTGGVDEFEAWKGVVRELDRRGVGECRVFGQGAVEILVSEKEDLERLEEVLMLLPDEQRRKYKITLGIDHRIHHHIGPDTRLPAPPEPPPHYFGGGGP